MCTQLCHLLWVKGSDGSSFLLNRNWRSVPTSSLPASNSQALSAELNICYETSDTKVSTKTTPGPGKAIYRFRLLTRAENPLCLVLSRCAPGPMHPPVLPSCAYRAFNLITHSQLASRHPAVTPALPHRPTAWCHDAQGQLTVPKKLQDTIYRPTDYLAEGRLRNWKWR